MGRDKETKDDLCQQPNIDLESTIQTLKLRYENNLMYTRIGDGILIALHPSRSDFQQSLDYVAEYKNGTKTSLLPCHIFQLVNQAYLHMRRTGIDQSIVLSGDTASGKSAIHQDIISHLVSLSTYKKESKLQHQIINAQTILDSFGHARASHPNASRFGKYMEIQFSDRGRMIGAKILNYLVNKKTVISNKSNFHVFYYLLSGATTTEKEALHLTDRYRYAPNYNFTEQNVEHYEALKVALKQIGLGKKNHFHIMQLLAAILHLGQLQFVDDTSVQEAACIKNTETLDLVSDFLGVDPQTLENVMTYKTQLIKNDVTTLILNADLAAKQRDELSIVLYSLLFNWMVEQLNGKLCSDDTHNFISILDFPGATLTPSMLSFDDFCLNYCNERIQNYIQTQVFEINGAEYKEDGLDYPTMDECSGNTECIDLFDQRRSGVIDIINNYSKKSKTSNRVKTDADMFDTLVRYHSDHPSFQVKKSETGAQLFAIQHFHGEQSYQPNGFLESNRDELNPDFITLFQGAAGISPSTNEFLARLFKDKSIHTESHPKQSDAIFNAQQVNKPVRSPSTRRSKSTRKQNKEGNDDGDDTKIKALDKSNVSVALAQLRSSMDELFSTLSETMPWFVFCIQATSSAATFDSQLVKNQVQIRNLLQIVKRSQIGSFPNVYLHNDFCERYHDILLDVGVEQDISQSAQCEALAMGLGWERDTDFAIGNAKIFINNATWRYLEDSLRAIEKLDKKRERQDQQQTLMEAPPSITQDQYTENTSHFSGVSQNDILTASSDYSGRRQLVTNAATTGLPMPRKFKDEPSSGYSTNRHSFASEINDNHFPMYETQAESDVNSNTSVNFEMKTVPVSQEQNQRVVASDEGESTVRKRWLIFVWMMTWWVPTKFMVWCGRMKRPDVQIAWREKLALCIIIFFMSAFIIWFLVFFGELICPHQSVYSAAELQAHDTSGNGYIAIRGEVFDLTRFAPHHWANSVISINGITSYAGTDATDLFPVQVSALCQGVNGTVSDYVSLDYHFNLTDNNARYHDFRAWTDDSRPDWYYEKMTYLRKNYKLGNMAYTRKDVKKQAEIAVNVNGEMLPRTWAVLNGSIYDLTYYVRSGRHIKVPEGMQAPTDIDTDYMYGPLVDLFRQMAGQDITANWNALPIDSDLRLRQEVCLRNLFYAGTVDERKSARCIFSEYLLLIVTVLLCLVIVFKFLAALQFGTTGDPQNHDKFVICQVPCYTEGEEELKKTIDSIATLKYDDKRKLLFLICDGMIVGGGNDRPTPRIVLDILGVDPSIDPEPLSFFSVGEGQRQHNMAKVYSGLYECRGHVVPYIVLSKVGKPSERQKPGNRGKRDSQLVLMRFLNKVHFGSPMAPMELELFHQIKNVIGVNPSFYEFILMVDADTEVMEDGMNRMVSAFVHDAKIIGLCGETKLSNEKDSWVTMIQVYEYFISHYMIKAFESLFASVTCLPGCFSMYRVRSATKNQPLLISNEVIEDYQINRVDTLHKKNLLHLGEDRYLTTLILKHFPKYKTKFVPDAKCATNAPDQWSVLLSQRRRWINSTIHNLGELVFLPQLCGFCCFSMRFVVMLDLISTLVQPAIVGYLVYLIYTLATSSSDVPIMSIITIAGVYGLQAIIFIIHKKWEHIIWMIVSIFAIPIFSLGLPLYAYWHFDDFSWGNTRVVLGEKGKKVLVGADESHFDPNTIPTMSWEKYEEGLYTTEDWHMDDKSVGSHGSRVSRGSNYSHGTYVSHGSYNSRPQQQASYAQSQYSYNGASQPNNYFPQPSFNNNSHQSMMMPQAPSMMMMPPNMNNSHPSMMMMPSVNMSGSPQSMMMMPPANVNGSHHSMMMSAAPSYSSTSSVNYPLHSYNPSSPLHRYE